MGERPRFYERSSVYDYHTPKSVYDPIHTVIPTSHGDIVIKDSWVVFPLGIHFKERMKYDEHVATESRRQMAIMPRYPVYFLDKGIWHEITHETMEARPVMTQYGENNAVILDFQGARFVKDGNSLYHCQPIEWRDQQNRVWTKSDWGFFNLDEYTEIKISSNLIVRFDADGYTEIKKPDAKSMLNEIVKKFFEEKILLEWVIARQNLRTLMPESAVALGCEELLNALTQSGMVTLVHSGKEVRLYRLASGLWLGAPEYFYHNYSSEIERIYNATNQK